MNKLILPPAFRLLDYQDWSGVTIMLVRREDWHLLSFSLSTKMQALPAPGENQLINGLMVERWLFYERRLSHGSLDIASRNIL